jgi:uncharacterized surface protein with fasciclin (FAS1) repeats
MKRIAALLVVAVAIPGAALAAPDQAATPKANIVQTAAGAGQFTTLLALAERAGLVGALSGPGKLTVFAPTDAAFKKVPKATLAKLGQDKALLKRVLLYHVVKGQVPAAKVAQLRSARTLAGPSVRIRVRGKNVFVDKAKVTKTDIRTSNGIIHVLNSVLIPAS